MPGDTETYIMEQLPPTDILIVDALNLYRYNPTHFNLEQALDVVRRLKPKHTYLVGGEEEITMPDVHVDLFLRSNSIPTISGYYFDKLCS